MRLICPNCQKSITVPDSDAGKMTKCPECGHSFPAPELYSLAPHEPPPAPAPPPVPEPATPPRLSAEAGGVSAYSVADLPPAPPPTPAPEPPVRAESTTPPRLPSTPESPETEEHRPLNLLEGHFYSFPLSPKAIRWLPAVCLSLALLLTFFKWVAAEPGGYKVYSQNAWQALFAGFSVDRVGEERVFHKAAELRDRLRASMWMLPYLFALLAAVPLAWALHFVKAAQVPLPLQTVWRYRSQVLLALGALTLLCLCLQWAIGFGLEHAVSQLALDEYLKEEKGPKPGDPSITPEQEETMEIEIGRRVGGFQLTHTFWLDLAFILHILALGGMVLEHYLLRRGNRPVPRVGILW